MPTPRNRDTGGHGVTMYEVYRVGPVRSEENWDPPHATGIGAEKVLEIIDRLMEDGEDLDNWRVMNRRGVIWTVSQFVELHTSESEPEPPEEEEEENGEPE